MPEAVIVDAVRTPIGRAFKGSLAQLRPDEMGAFVLDALLERNPEVDPELIEEVYCGVGLPQGLQGFNIARIMVLLSKQLPLGVNGATVSRYCASSLETIRQAANAVVAGQGDAYIAAGVEWVSRYNEAVEGARPQDQNEKLQGRNGQPDAYISMGMTAENVADRYEVSRADMDKYAQRSQELAVRVAGERLLRPRDRAGHAARRDDGRQGRRPARQLDAREAVAARPRLQRGRQGDRRQLVSAQRRRGRRAGDVGRQGRRAGAEAARPRDHLGHGGDRAGVHGRGADRSDPQGARPRRHDDRATWTPSS